ncbi:ROK family protein [uncultured Thomasclavelia sp.]|uniref:ROK family protein n=1 Tax=uncultured Thomasclavelia sp. TaxID=3025759 RepID=UPI0025FB0170|nr:ROK family protein [uncultured Thomasclavelia sp.]
MALYLAMDVGGTSIKYGVIDDLGVIKSQGKVVTPDSLEKMYQIMEDIYHQIDQKIDGIALSMPGAVDSEVGIIEGSSALDYIHGPNIKNDLMQRLNLRVTIENDANCAALAEVWKGAASKVNDCMFIVSGTGIGGAVVKNRLIHKGKHLHGGEFGYMVALNDIENDQYICWSEAGSTVAVVKAVAKELDVPVESLDGKEIFDQADTNPVYQKYVNQYYSVLAMGIFNLQYVYDPEMIVIGGAISARDDLIEQVESHLDKIYQKISHAKIRPQVVKCHFAGEANLIGAVYHFLNS